MSDNVAITPGSGVSVASDDVGGVQFQRVKPNFGEDGAATDVSLTNPMPVSANDLAAALKVALSFIANPPSVDPTSGRLRVVLDPAGGGQTLGTVTTVGTVSTVTGVTTVTTVTTVATVTNQAQVGGVQANSCIYDQMHNAWANVTRGRIT